MWPRALILGLVLAAGDGFTADALPRPPSSPPLPLAASVTDRLVYAVELLQDCGGAMHLPSEPGCFRLTNARMPEIVIQTSEAAPLAVFFRLALSWDQDVEIIVTRRAKR